MSINWRGGRALDTTRACCGHCSYIKRVAVFLEGCEGRRVGSQQATNGDIQIGVQMGVVFSAKKGVTTIWCGQKEVLLPLPTKDATRHLLMFGPCCNLDRLSVYVCARRRMPYKVTQGMVMLTRVRVIFASLQTGTTWYGIARRCRVNVQLVPYTHECYGSREKKPLLILETRCVARDSHWGPTTNHQTSTCGQRAALQPLKMRRGRRGVQAKF